MGTRLMDSHHEEGFRKHLDVENHPLHLYLGLLGTRRIRNPPPHFLTFRYTKKRLYLAPAGDIDRQREGKDHRAPDLG